ncbi:hypothetical protein TWF730_001399 [Orbilia blumenaviensis]|uniref:Myb-like domain-containing protein n=1 Tax=Orbilia blumenaviensis TaxID=1796055 RepID=A0AAV9UKM2_9PEZI
MSSPAWSSDLDDLFDERFLEGSPPPLADENTSSNNAYSPIEQSASDSVASVTRSSDLLLPVPPAQIYQPTTIIRNLHFPVLAPVSAPTALPDSAVSPSADDGPPKRKNKPRRNWEREETIRLVKGVEKHGIGAWAKIHADEEFDLSHRKPWDLKDRFRTMWPTEYKDHDGLSFFQLDVDAAADLKKKMRKKTKRRGKERVAEEEGPSASGARTATGRRKVTKRKGTEWSADEEADLMTAFERHGRIWRTWAADRGFAFHGRSISDIQQRFSELYPELANWRPASLSRPLTESSDQATAFERGLHNGFGTQGVTWLQAQRISALTSQSPSLSPNDGTPGAGGIVHPPAQEVGAPRPDTYTPEGIVGQDLGFPSPIAALSPANPAQETAGWGIQTPPMSFSELAATLQLFTPPAPLPADGPCDVRGQMLEAPPVV